MTKFHNKLHAKKNPLPTPDAPKGETLGVIINVPTYQGGLHFKTVEGLMNCSPKGLQRNIYFTKSSFSSLIMNAMWARSLNMRKDGFTHFAMLHSDICPDGGWLDKLMEIMVREKADIVAAVSPIKTNAGLTSVALDTGVDKYSPPRFTMRQLHEMPKNFTHPKLLVNNGLMLVDMRKPWVEKAYFDIENTIEFDSERKEFVAKALSEDWIFSRLAASLGAKIVSTIEVGLVHVGTGDFPTHFPWGDMLFDQINGEAVIEGLTPVVNPPAPEQSQTP